MTNNTPKTGKFAPTLRLSDATTIGVGAIVGAGIYIITGILAGLSGSALVFSMLLASGVALLTGLSFAELAVWLPKDGSVYEFAHQLVNPFVGVSLTLGISYES